MNIVTCSGEGNVRLVEVEVVVQKGYKPFLGGFKHSKSGTEYHHAITQTVGGAKRDWNQYVEDTCTRPIQTVHTRNSFQQTDLDKGTQTATRGFHVCISTPFKQKYWRRQDPQEIFGDPKRYVNSTDFRLQQIGAVMIKKLTVR